MHPSSPECASRCLPSAGVGPFLVGEDLVLLSAVVNVTLLNMAVDGTVVVPGLSGPFEAVAVVETEKLLGKTVVKVGVSCSMVLLV